MTIHKTAQASHYRQIANLLRAFQRMAQSVAGSKADSSAEKAVKRQVWNLLQNAKSLYDTASSKGLTAQHSAASRNSLEEKLDELLSQVRSQEYNPYEDNVYVMVEDAAPSVYSALNRYIPQSMSAARPAVPKTEESRGLVPGQPGYSPVSPKHEVKLPEKQPWEHFDPETIPAPSGSELARLPTAETPTDTGVAREKRPTEQDRTFTPLPVKVPPARLAPPVELPRLEPYPAPGESLPPAKRSSVRNAALKKLGIFYRLANGETASTVADLLELVDEHQVVLSELKQALVDYSKEGSELEEVSYIENIYNNVSSLLTQHKEFVDLMERFGKVHPPPGNIKL